MNILEFQAKDICVDYGIPVPRSILLSSISAIPQLDQHLIYPVILKSQVHSSDRGRLGGICLARNSIEAADMASRMFSSQIHDQYPPKLLAEEMIQFSLGFAIRLLYDESNLDIVLRVSPTLTPSETNGTEIIDSAPFYFNIDPVEGLLDSVILDIASALEIDRLFWRAFSVLLRKVWDLFRDLDIVDLTINPLVISTSGSFFVLGIDMEFDDKAIFRQSNLKTLADFPHMDEMRSVLQKLDCDYQSGIGQVAVISGSIEMCGAIKGLLSENQIDASDLIACNGYISSEVIKLVCERVANNTNADLIIIHYLGAQKEVEAIIAGVRSYVAETDGNLPIVLRLNATPSKNRIKDFDRKSVTFIDSLKDLDAIIRERIEIVN